MRQISSAEPEKLFRYASFGLQLDRDAMLEASRLGGVLQHFEASCSEPGFQVRCSDLAGSIGSRGSQGESLDIWVRQVGLAFQRADSMWTGGRKDLSSNPILRTALFSGIPSLALLQILPQVPGWLSSLVSRVLWLQENKKGLDSSIQRGEPAAQSRTGGVTRQQKINQVREKINNTPYLKYGFVYGEGRWSGYAHPGVDIKGEKDEEVRPIGPGKIVKIQTDPGGYGRYVVIEHTLVDGRKVYSLYGHLSEESTKELSIDDEVGYDTVIGKIGETGNWGGAHHVHMEVRTQEGFDNWKVYADLKKSDWRNYWLDPVSMLDSISDVPKSK